MLAADLAREVCFSAEAGWHETGIELMRVFC
jgi:hypothetical protein